MNSFYKIFFWGMLISFLGSLPPGVINIAAAHIAAEQGKSAGVIYAFGSMLAEVIVVRLALSGMKQLIRQYRVFYFLELLTAALLLVMTIACFIAAMQMNNFANIFPKTSLPPFWAGVALSIINPLHIPFWLGWTTVLMNKGVLSPQPRLYNIYITGIGLGTIAGFVTFIFGGDYLMKTFQSNQYFINCILGIALFITAFLHIKKMVMIPLAIRHAKVFRRSE